MMNAENYVDKLNQYLQKNDFSEFKYEDVGTNGPDHMKTFTIRVVVNGKTYPDGVGNNKKEAKQNAAKHALKGLLEKSENASDASVGLVLSQDYVSWLNSYAQKIKMELKCNMSRTTTFQCQFVVGKIVYPVGTGTTKKEAKEEAAKLAYHKIVDGSMTEDEKASSASSQETEEMRKTSSEICKKTQNLKTEDEGIVEINYIGLINAYCQKNVCPLNFISARRSGPPHNPKFSYRVVIDGKDYPVCEGKSIKEAKQNAAKSALSILNGEPHWDSEVNSAPESLDASPNLLRSHVAQFKSISPPPSFGKSPDNKAKFKIAANFQNPCTQEEAKRANAKVDSVSRFKEDFEFIEHIDSGGFGSVFKAKHKLEGKQYAVKMVSCEEKSIREVSALSELQHKNIVRYYTSWLEETPYQGGNTAHSFFSRHPKNPSSRFLYIQMELCDTRTLRVWIDDMNTKCVERSQRRQKSLDIAQQIVSGVECIHDKKLIHRDLKPANILFGLDGFLKIGDFGLVAVDYNPECPEERSGCKGTKSYMAPEQKTKNTYDRKVDIFALGLIYFELLWEMPTYGEREKIWYDIRNQALPPQFSHHFHGENQMIKSMLCFKPEDRPEASQLKMYLEEIAHALTLGANDRKTV